MPSNAFFRLSHAQKKFSETVFTKLSSNPCLVRTTKDSTNYFSVICQIFLFQNHESHVRGKVYPGDFLTDRLSTEGI